MSEFGECQKFIDMVRPMVEPFNIARDGLHNYIRTLPKPLPPEVADLTWTLCIGFDESRAGFFPVIEYGKRKAVFEGQQIDYKEIHDTTQRISALLPDQSATSEIS